MGEDVVRCKTYELKIAQKGHKHKKDRKERKKDVPFKHGEGRK